MKKHLLLSLLLIAKFSIAQTHDYALAQHLSTYFLGAQRSGDTQSWIQPEGSGGSHTTDGQAVGKDLSGGWYDCGDYIKFHATGPYTALLYLYGYDKYPEAYADNYSQAYSKPPSNGIPDVLDEVKIETDYLIKCANDGITIYWQVGDGRDHNSFSDAQTNSNENLYGGTNIRPVYAATEGHSNAFGGAAAALALMSIVYEQFDPIYAQQCEDAAIKYYNVGKINPATSGDALNEDFYNWMTGQYSHYQDEMGMGAALLYRATNNNTYLTEAENFASSAQKWGTFNYGSIDHLLFFELYKITDKVAYLDLVKWRVDNYELESCGYDHITNWGSLRDASNSALLAALYHNEVGGTSYYGYAKSNIDFILGSHASISPDAPANFSFLIGYNQLGGGYPQHPHHAGAFGKGSDAWTLYTNENNNPGSVNYAYELKGGLAGGPEAECATFEDKIGNYVSSEYCIYYNAAFTSAVAYINKVENNIVTPVLAKTPSTIEVGPNPVKDFVQILIKGEVNCQLLDSAGRVLSNFKILDHKKINVTSYAKGMYFIKRLDTGESLSFIKQ